MALKLLDLQPNRSLLNSNFDGYKLYLSEIAESKLDLQTPADQVLPDLNNYSLLHAKYYGLHNHLIGEHSDKESVYFVDKFWRIRKVFVDETGQLVIKILWEMPRKRVRQSGDYNATIKLISDNLAAVADGTGFVYLLNRRNRANNEAWELLLSEEVLGSEQKFVLSDAVLVHKDAEEVHLLLLSINHKSTASSESGTVVNWVTFVHDTDLWHRASLKELICNGFIQYLSFEPDAQAIYVASDSQCKFVFDSECQIEHVEVEENETTYYWSQSNEDVIINVFLPDNPIKSLINVRAEMTKLTIKYGDKVLIGGDLYEQIEADLTCWTVGQKGLEVNLTKRDKGCMWSEAIKNDSRGKYLEDLAALESSFTTDSESSRGMTFNSQQVEECDFECDKFTIFERISCASHKTTHKVNLGSNQILLKVKLDADLPLALGVRYDVDVCVWQPKQADTNFSLEHKGTLLAMGYIQASKQQKKFLVCSPGMSYTVVSEAAKHLFIYCQNKTISSQELINRKTGQRSTTIAQQKIINLTSKENILGICAFNSMFYILQENSITAFKV